MKWDDAGKEDGYFLSLLYFSPVVAQLLLDALADVPEAVDESLTTILGALLASELAARARPGLELFAAQLMRSTLDWYFEIMEQFNFGKVSFGLS